MAVRRLSRLVLLPVLVLGLGATARAATSTTSTTTGAAAPSSTTSRAATPYVNPFPNAGYFVGRTDMGVDVCLNAGDPIVAVGTGIVVGIQKNWYAKQPYIWYELTTGADAGSYVYVAEQITGLVKVGTALTAGQTIATYAKTGSCIETGWATANGETQAVASTGYTEGQVTKSGISFARFLISLGVQGTFELTAAKTQTVLKKRKSKSTKVTTTTKTTTTTTTTSSSSSSASSSSKPLTSSSSSQSGGSAAPSASGGATTVSASASKSSGGSPSSSGGAASDGSSWFGATASGGAGWS
jgi:hypothetical protein